MSNPEAPLGLTGASIAVGEPLRIYFTFDAATTGESNGGFGVRYTNAIKRIRVIVGEDEFTNSGSGDANIIIVENVLEAPFSGLDVYRNQYQFTYASGQTALGSVTCGFAVINRTPMPIPTVVIGGLAGDPPDLGIFSVPGYPAHSDHLCFFTSLSTGMYDTVRAYGSSLTRVGGPIGSDVDGDGIGDVDDVCPADPEDTCTESGSGAAVISAAAGGTVSTPGSEVLIVAEPGDVIADSTLSVTRLDPAVAGVDLAIGSSPGLGEAVAAYDLEPDGVQFGSPVSLTITLDVTAMTPEQRDTIDVYRFEDLDGDGVNDTFVPLTASCAVDEEPVSTFTARCQLDLNHFSKYAVIAPRDTDSDGIFDSFAGQVDVCIAQNATGFDADDDGCIESFGGLTDLVRTLVTEDVIPSELESSLLSKIANANASATRDNVCAAIGQLAAFRRHVDAQIGKKISLQAASRVTSYSDSLIRYQRTRLTEGALCTT